jgi:hypothetical protein
VLESRTQVWRDVEPGGEIDRERVHRARGKVVVLLALLAAVLVAHSA